MASNENNPNEGAQAPMFFVYHCNKKYSISQAEKTVFLPAVSFRCKVLL